MEKLLLAIEEFKKWAAQLPEEEKIGEWECDYDGVQWNVIRKQWKECLACTNFENWDLNTIEQVLYIIARDNEVENFASDVAEKEALLLFLAKWAIEIGERDAKWQIAVQLKNCKNKKEASELLELYVQDKDEYVNRRALMAFAEVNVEKTAYYCQLAWNRTAYGDLQEYQRIAVLHALHSCGSPLIEKYIALAKQDGRKYLLQNAREIENERKMHTWKIK